jgi:hypothetical protein
MIVHHVHHKRTQLYGLMSGLSGIAYDAVRWCSGPPTEKPIFCDILFVDAVDKTHWWKTIGPSSPPHNIKNII